MALQKLETEVRRKQIVQAVLNLIATQGLKRLSVGAVARRVGIVPSAIYRHFKSKDEMVDAAFDFVRARALEHLNRICAEEPKALDRLERLVMLHVQMVRELQALPRIVFSEGHYADAPERRARAYELLRGMHARLEEIVRAGQEAGEIRADLDARAVAVMTWGLLPPAVILWHMSDGRFDVTRHTEKAWRILRAAIAAKELPATTQSTGRGNTGIKENGNEN